MRTANTIVVLTATLVASSFLFAADNTNPNSGTEQTNPPASDNSTDQAPSANRPSQVVPGAVEGDINKDGTVDSLDLLAVINAWGKCGSTAVKTCDADLDRNGVVDERDLMIVVKYWSAPATR